MGCVCSLPASDPIPISILFLDVDGVLNTSATRPAKVIGNVQLKHLNYILTHSKYETKIVLSSNWRKRRNLRKYFRSTLKSYLNIKNIDDLVIGVTPTLLRKKRAIEIGEYFKINAGNLNKSYVIKSWAVLDDMNLDKPNAQCQQIMYGHFVKVDRIHGLTMKDAQKVVNTLNVNEIMPNIHTIETSKNM